MTDLIDPTTDPLPTIDHIHALLTSHEPEAPAVLIASVRGAEHAAAVSVDELEAHLASTPVDVANLIARAETAEAEIARLKAANASMTSERDAAIARADAAERELAAAKDDIRKFLGIEIEEPEDEEGIFDRAKRRVRAMIALASRAESPR